MAFSASCRASILVKSTPDLSWSHLAENLLKPGSEKAKVGSQHAVASNIEAGVQIDFDAPDFGPKGSGYFQPC